MLPAEVLAVAIVADTEVMQEADVADLLEAELVEVAFVGFDTENQKVDTGFEVAVADLESAMVEDNMVVVGPQLGVVGPQLGMEGVG